ncbi:MAG: hypothetical protein AB1705_18440 [Verrucomicrobiota bacterium]
MAGGTWQSPSNWSPVGVPAADDDVVIDLDLTGNYVVTLDGNATVRSLTVGRAVDSQTITLNINTGTLTVAGPTASTVRTRGSITVTGGTLTLGGPLTLEGVSQMSAGAINVNDSLTGKAGFTLAGGIFTVSGTAQFQNQFTFSGGTVTGPGTFDWAGAASWTGGSLTGSGRTQVLAAGSLILDGASDKTINQRTFLNAGTVTWRGSGRLLLQNNPAVTNTAAFVIDGASTLLGVTVPGAFYNSSGTVTRQISTGTTTIENVQFNNPGNGAVSVQAGVLALKSGGSSTGVYNIGVNGRIDLIAGTYNFDAGCSLTNSGLLRVAGGTASFNDTVSVYSQLELTAGTITGAGRLKINTGTFTWTGGVLTGTGLLENTTGTMNFAGTSDLLLSRPVLNLNTLNWTGTGALRANNGTVLENRGASALFHIQNDRQFALTGAGIGGLPILTNVNAVIRKSVAAGETLFNGWLLQCYEATLDVKTGSVRFARDTHDFHKTCTFSGQGLIAIDGGVLRLMADLNASPPYISSTIDSTTANIVLSAGGTAGPGYINIHSGTFTWTGGIIAGVTLPGPQPSPLRIHNPSVMNISGPAAKVFADRLLENYGTVNWSGTGDIFISPAIGNNGLFLVLNDQTLSGGRFGNGGTFRKVGTPGRTLAAGLAFGNGGLVEILSGTFEIRSSETNSHSGRFSPNPGTQIQFTQGMNLLSSGTLFTNTGLSLLTNATFFVYSNSTAVIAGLVRMEPSSTLMGIHGASVLRITGTLDWAGGTMMTEGPTEIAPGGLLHLSGSSNKVIEGRTINNAGTILWSGTGHLYGGSNAVLNNSNLFLIQNNASFRTNEGGAKFLNAGVLRKTTATGNTLFDGYTFQQYGSLDVQSGAVIFRTGAHALYKDALFTGDGLCLVDGATLDITPQTTTVIQGRFQLTNGVISGAGALDIAGTFLWSGGTLYGTNSPATTVTPAGTLLFTNTNPKDLDGRAFTNLGIVQIVDPAPVRLFNSARFRNEGQFIAAADATVQHAGGTASYFVNAGTLVRDVTAGTLLFENLGFTNSGTLDLLLGSLRAQPHLIQTGGATRLNGGSLSTPGEFQLLGGILRGAGTVTAATVVNRALLNPGNSTGILTVAGDYVQGTDGTFVVDIGGRAAGTEYDRLTVSGMAFLGGRLQLVLTNDFVPTTNDTFQVLTCAGRTGLFGQTLGRVVGSNIVFRPLYLSGGVTLTLADASARFRADGLSLLSGQFQFYLEGLSEEAYVIEFSQDLQNWIPLATNIVSSSGSVQITDPTPPAHRFYRALFQP